MANMVMRVFLPMLMAAQTVTAQDPIATLKARVSSRVSEVQGATVGVVFAEVGGRAAFSLNEDSVFHAASTMKLPVMIEYFRALDTGRIKRDQDLLLGTEFRSIVYG